MFIDTLRAEMPPAAGQDAASRVRTRVLASRSTHKSPALRRSWRVAGSFAAAAAVFAVAVLLMAPRMETAAFARDRAVDALMFQTPGRVLHLEMTYTQKDQRTAGEVLVDTNERWSVWVDTEGKRLREEFVDNEDGSLNEMHVRTGERDIVFHSDYPDESRLVEYDATDQRIVTALDDWIPYMRARIADGTAQVTGTQTIDGDEYWVVECKSDEGDITERVTLRKSDYLLKTWARDLAYEVDGASGMISKGATLEVIAQLDPATLPTDFFSIDAARDAAKRETPFEKP
jgi:hypothetical protein